MPRSGRSSIDAVVPAPALRVGRAVGATLVALWVTFAAAVLLGGLSPVALGAVNDSMVMLLAAGAAASTVLRVALVRHQRAVWLPMAVGLTSYGAGAVLWTAWIERLPEPPFPSPADPLWLALYPLSFATIVLAVRAQVGRVSASVWLDGLIGTLSVSALGVAALLGPMLHDATGSSAAVATNLAYPLGDVLVAAAVVGGFALTGWRLNRASLLLAAGFVAFMAADALYLEETVSATYVTRSVENLLWGGGLALIGRAPWAPVGTVGGGRRHLAAALPAACALSALGLLIYDHLHRIDPVSVGLAAATVAVAMVRLIHTAREERHLFETQRQARTDELTGLPNRRALGDVLDGALGEHRADVAPLGLLVIDLNGFKELNDTLGHEAGDEVLRAVGLRLDQALRPGDLLVRLGGDEFAVVLEDCAGPGVAEHVATNLLRALEAPFPVMGISVQIGASIGVACHPEHGRTASELLKRADVAMYRAKGARTGVERYDGSQDGRSAERLALVGQLGHAIAAGEIRPYYQPQIHPGTGRLLGVEALARWEHPELGVLSPGRFLPAVEQSSLSRLLTLSILERAVAEGATWREDGLDISMSVNLSAANLVDDDFDADVAGILARHGLPADRLRLEITENIFVTDPERALRLLHRLRDMGVRLSLDDFGTKHSSLSHLDALPVDELKIDRSFIAELTSNQRTALIVSSTIQLAASLGLHAVAEGIEDYETWSALTALGCPAIQGYAVARPMRADALPEWAAGRPANRIPTADLSGPALRPNATGAAA